MLSLGPMFGLSYGMYEMGLWYGVKIMLNDRESDEFKNSSIACYPKNNHTAPDDLQKVLDCVSSCFRFDLRSTVACVLGILQGGMGMGQPATYAEDLNLARTGAVQIFKVIKRETAIDSSSNKGAKPTLFGGHVKFIDVSFNYPSCNDVRIFKDFNLEIEKGKTVALV